MYCHYIGWCIGKCPLYRGVIYSECPLYRGVIYSECPLSEAPLCVKVYIVLLQHQIMLTWYIFFAEWGVF